MRKLHFTFFGYVLFGAGYVSYMTFVIALLRGESLPGWVPTAFWITLGVSSAAFIGPWGRHLARARGANGQALVYGIVLLGTLPILVHVGPATALVSAIVFGSAFMSGPTAVTAISRHVLQPGGWTAGIALMTTAFALGQAVGPLLSGILSDGSGGLKAGLSLSRSSSPPPRRSRICRSITRITPRSPRSPRCPRRSGGLRHEPAATRQPTPRWAHAADPNVTNRPHARSGRKRQSQGQSGERRRTSRISLV